MVRKEIKKVAIADPEKSTYGAAALKALQATDLWSGVKKKIVTLNNVVQVFQQVNNREADVGFCAMSMISSEYERKGCYFALQEAPLIMQAVCELKRAQRNPALPRFMEFLKSSEAANIKLRFGYE